MLPGFGQNGQTAAAFDDVKVRGWLRRKQGGNLEWASDIHPRRCGSAIKNDVVLNCIPAM